VRQQTLSELRRGAGDHPTLMGTVHSFAEKRAAERVVWSAVWSAAGVATVEDLISVNSFID
jgi:osmotically-inducible protein OsmY